MEDQVAVEQGYGVMTDPGYVGMQQPVSVADGAMEVPATETAVGMDTTSVANEQTATAAEQHHDASNDTMTGADGTAAGDGQEQTVLTEEDRLWGVVRANPADFTAWTALIQEVDKLDITERIHRVYDTFLAEFPLCYGYWKKYADHEARLGSHESIVSVYERAVQAVTYSVDIWTHYCSYLISKQEDPAQIRSLFERGLEYVGTDYLSHILWDKYLEFEGSLNEINRVSRIYARIIQLPIQQLDRYYQSYKAFIGAHTYDELKISDDDSTVSSGMNAAQPSEGVDASAVDSDTSMKSSQLSDEEALAKLNAMVDEMYKMAKEQDSRIVEYESAIRRPYFHVKPLDDAQLANWHRYLDFIEKEGDLSKIVKLYERCLIACANYPEYWIRYVMCMDTDGRKEYAIDALYRATQIFVKRRPEIHMFAARLKEEHGDIDGARFEYQHLNSTLAPGLLECIIKSANFEQRQGNTEAACATFTTAIEYEKTKEESRSVSLLYIQYARFVDQVLKDTEKARGIYSEALALLPSSKILWEALIHFEAYQPGQKDIERLDSIIEQAISPKTDAPALSPIDREEISSIFLEFVDLFGDLKTLKKAEARHLQLFPLRKSNIESRKRPSSDGISSDRAKVLKTYNSTTATVSPAQVTTPAYANGQAQWGAAYTQQGYAQPAQGWQQPAAQTTPQVQPQQWTPGYTAQQAGYNAYGSYGAYAPTQQQTLAPAQQQTASAYGSYPQTYATQATYPQQPSYGQPQAPAQQGYYAGYY